MEPACSLDETCRSMRSMRDEISASLVEGSWSSLSSRAEISASFGVGSRSSFFDLGAELPHRPGAGRLDAFEILLQQVDAFLEAAKRVVLAARIGRRAQALEARLQRSDFALHAVEHVHLRVGRRVRHGGLGHR